MDNQEHLQQGFELPKPQTEGLTPSAEGSPEVGAYQEQKTASGPTADPGVSAQTTPSVQAIAGVPTLPVDPAVAHTSHLGASDVDLIEKEWVLKAKAIVAHTHGDPYTQNKEINKIKADYIKKRYNKELRTE